MLKTTLPHVLQYGFTLLPDEQREAADLWLVNTCTVKSPSQSAMDNVISAGRQLGKHLIVAGCVPQGESPPQVACFAPVMSQMATNSQA